MRCEIRLLTSVTARCYDKVSKECLTCDRLSVRLSLYLSLSACPVCPACRCLLLSCVCVGLSLSHFSCSCGCCFSLGFHIAALCALLLNTDKHTSKPTFIYAYRGLFIYIYIYWQRHVDETAAEPHTFLFTLQKVLSASQSLSFSRPLSRFVGRSQ